MEFLQYNSRTEQGFDMNGGKKRGGGGRNCAYVNGGEDFAAPVKQRSQANARERDRTHSVNTAFSTLRTLIPTEPKDRKLSKIETLRLASSYISHLGTQLIAGPIDQPCLRLSKTLDDDPGNPNRPQVCTFCIAHKKTPKNNLQENFDCPAFDAQIFLNPGSPSLSGQILTANDLNSIYYQ